MSKGDWRRPPAVDAQTASDNHCAVFGHRVLAGAEDYAAEAGVHVFCVTCNRRVVRRGGDLQREDA
jgi:hypothetical protein